MNLVQEVFDAVWLGKQADGFQKTGDWNDERHILPLRGNGCGCALDHAYRAFGYPRVMDLPQPIWNGLRLCHDQATSPSNMERRFREFAKAHSLTIPDEKPAQTFQDFMAKVQEPLAFIDVTAESY